MKKLIYISLLFVTGIVIINSCKHLPPVESTIAPPPISGNCNCVCFESNVLPLFQTNCATTGCHDAASHLGDYVLDSYANIWKKGITPGSATDSKIYKVLFKTGNDQMPPPPNAPLTNRQKTLIGNWINEGANNTINCNPYPCDSNTFKYSTNISVIMSTYCTGNNLCHSGPAPISTLNLTTYNEVKQVALNGRLVGAVTHTGGYEPMPKNLNKLSDCEIAQIKKWVVAGAPNN